MKAGGGDIRQLEAGAGGEASQTAVSVCCITPTYGSAHQAPSHSGCLGPLDDLLAQAQMAKGKGV